MLAENCSVYIWAVCILFIVLGISCLAAAMLKATKIKERNLNQKEEILQYQNNLTEIYDMMRIFRHDYKNTIVALKGCYDDCDYEKIGDILNSITKDFEKIDNYHQMNAVSQIEDTALKWLLISKLSVAQKQGIATSLLISNKLSYGKLKPHEFNSIIGNLLDNAIEAAVESDKKQIKIGLLAKEGDMVVSIKNTYKNKPSTTDIYKKGHTGKHGHSGYGLYGVKKIIDKHDEVLIDIRVTDEYFSVDINISNV